MQELSLNVLDIAQNSVRAGATQIQIEVCENKAEHTLRIVISDNGCGMTPEQVEHVQDPFFTTRTTRKVGLGVPLFKMAAEMTGGQFDIQSEPGKGTATSALFRTDSVDFVPLGDMSSSIVTLITMNTQIDFTYRYRVDGKEFLLETAVIKQMLDGVALNEPEIMVWLKEYINEQMKEISGV